MADQVKIKIVGDDSAFQKTLSGIDNVAQKGLSALTKGFAVAATGLTALTTVAVKSYADYEQLIGGVDTLFKTSSQTVQENAAKAYKTAGMSANTYMETVTGFAASLKQSFADTEEGLEQAAGVADMAITDIADNVSKFGTSMESVQLAYQGFAKQQYGLLDNLKLGYGGCKEEMERLLSDAEKITGIKYDITNLADVYNAIHVIQEQLGVTGSAAKEASTTIAGSASMMKASWQNALVGFADENADLDRLLDELTDSVVTFADNLMPRVETALSGVGSFVSKAAESLFPKLIDSFAAVAPGIAKAAVDAVAAFVSGISQNADAIATAAVEIGTVLVQGLIEIIPQIVSAGGQILSAFATSLGNAVPILSPLTSVVNALSGHLGTLISVVVGAKAAIVAYNTITTATTTLTTAWTAATAALTAMEAKHALTLVASNGGLTVFQTIVGLCTGQITLKTAAVGLATKAQMLWNAAMSANPLGLLLAAVVAVTAAIAVFTLCMEDEKSEADLLAEEIDELTERVEENRKAYEQAREARKKAVSEIESEYGHYESLVEELDSLVDANGNVKEGYEDRANAITGILSDALGTEITLDSMVAQGKQAIIDNIYALIDAKKQEALMRAYQEEYNQSIKTEIEQQKLLAQAYADKVTAEQHVNKIMTAARESDNENVQYWLDMYESGEKSAKQFSAALEANGVISSDARKEFNKWAKNLDKANGSVKSVTEEIIRQNDAQANYEAYMGAILNGDAEEIAIAMAKMNHAFVSAERGNASSLSNQLSNAKNALEGIKVAFEQGSPGITAEMVQEFQTMYDLSCAELLKFAGMCQKKGDEAGAQLTLGFLNEITGNQYTITDAVNAVADGVEETLSSVDSAGAAEKTVTEYADTISSKKGEVDSVANDIKRTVEDDLNSVDGAGAGSKAVNEFAGSISAGAGEAQSASVSVAENAGAGFGSVSMAPYGMAATWSYANGISSNVGNIVGAWVSVQNATRNGLTIDISGEGEGAIQTFASGIQAKGPLAVSASGTIANNSKAKLKVNTYSSGTNFAQGFINGMRAMMTTVNATAYNMGRGAKNSLSSAIGEQSPAKETIKSGKYFGEGFVIGLNKSADGVNGASATLARGSLIAFNNELAKGVQDSVASVFAKGFKNGLPENDEENTKRFNSFKESLDKQLQYGVITQQEYYEGIAKYRDEYLTAGTKEWFDATDSIYEYTENALEEQIQSEREILDRSHRFGIISDAEYYASLEAIRDKYFKVGSDEWFDYTEEIFDYHEQLKEDAIEKAEEAREKAQEVLSDVLDEAKDFSEKLSDVGGLYDSDAIIGVEYHWSEDGRTLTEKAVKGIAPADLNAQTAEIQRYAENLKELKGKVPAEMFGLLRDMSVKDGLAFTDALLAYDDAALNAYVKAWEDKQKAINGITAELYGAEVVEASLTLMDAIEAEADVELPEKFFDIGEASGARFTDGFMEKLQELTADVSSVLDSIYSFPGTMHEYMHQNAFPVGTTYAPTYVLQSAKGESTVRQLQTIQNTETQKRLGNWR